MKITNRHNLPQPFVDLASANTYSAGDADITTTSLFMPPKIRELMKRHGDKVTEDCSDMVWSILGTATHAMIEEIAKADGENYVAEVRYYMQIEGKKLGGQIDLYDRRSKRLYDFKVTSVYKYLSGEREEWTCQANVNRLLCQRNGLEVNSASILLIAKDWRKFDAKTKPDYPPCAIIEIPLEIWTEEKTLGYITERIKLHDSAETQPDSKIPHCTPSERWATPTTYVVKKTQTSKRSVANGSYGSLAEAQSHAGSIRGTVERREGIDKRCSEYCRVNSFCSYYQKRHSMIEFDWK